MITAQLVAEAIERARGDKNVHRIASYFYYRGYALGSGDMNAIRDILGEAHPELTIEAKPVQPKGRKKGVAFHKRVKGGAA